MNLTKKTSALTVKIPTSLHVLLRIYAAKSGKKIQDIVGEAIRERIGRE